MRDEFSLQMYLLPGEQLVFERNIIALQRPLKYDQVFGVAINTVNVKYFAGFMELVTFLQERDRNERKDEMD